MKIGIVGIGMVGSAILKSFKEKCDKDQILSYDKYKNIGKLTDLFIADVIFLCLPTLYDVKTNSYDKTSINEICQELSDNNYQGIVILKSTVEPYTTNELSKKYNISILHNPEFLTARNAFYDFHNQKHIVLGLTDELNGEKIIKTINLFHFYYPNAEISVCTSTESETMKIFCNNFYSVKIQFFTELYLLCQKCNINFEIVKKLMIKNGWINPMHTVIPGTDGGISYGGLCFPKDTNALLSFMKKNNTPCKVLEAAVTERNTMRND